QSGHTVSGTITTDGKTGLLETSDITSWSVTIDDSTFRSTDGSSTAAVGVFATLNGIKIPGFGGGLVLENDPSGDMIDWIRVPLDSDLSSYSGHLDSINLWNTFNPALGGTNPWLIASSVPEPSSFILAAFGVLMIVGGCSRLRNARATVLGD